jgi:nucleotide-binding universal stress UspA family protein
MIEIKRILCPVDFSEFSYHALEYAVVLAQWYESEITVLHAFSMPIGAPVVPYAGAMLPEPPVVTPAHREQLGKSLEEFVEPLAGCGVRICRQIGEGPAVDQIVAHAKSASADLIVIGTHGRSGFERLLLGSVAEKVLRKASCPVLTVPARAEGTTAPSFTRILCAVDFSESSLRGLQYALSLAQEADAALTVVHVLEMAPEAESFETPGFNFREYAAQFAAHAGERLAAGAREYCRVKEMVTVGKPYREILRLATELGSDLVVIGIRGRGAADLMMFGSTAQHVVRASSCPVLTLRTA